MHAAITAAFAVILAGASAFESPSQNHEVRAPQGIDLLRLLIERPWLNPHRYGFGRVDAELGPRELEVINEMDEEKGIMDDLMRRSADKRSAVATALNSGRRRRQPTPALGVLNDMGNFFDSLRDNLETLAALSPEQRSTLFQGPPTVVQATSSGGSGGGSGIRKLHALRPLRPTGNIRSYNRRSFVEVDGGYPGANHHDPGLLWTGLGR